jgi:microcin C transport system substrate-binding protein
VVLGSAFRILLLLLVALAAAPARAAPEHAIAMLSQPKYGPDFTHFDYADPNAPKGGTLTESAIGTFDNLNPYIVNGAAATGLGLIGNTLTVGSQDEPFTEYGSLAKTIDVADDRASVTYELRPEARWQDGQPITADDVVFSLETLRTKGSPFYRAYYANVVRAEKLGEGKVRFVFENGSNRELPLIMGQLPIVPKHYWEGREFDKTTLEAPIGGGPYRIKSVDPGRSITYERVKDWWGADLPVNKGRYNYDEIRFEYYRDPNVALEAFKAGRFDLRVENSSRFWATGYQGPALDQGLIVKDEIPTESGSGMQAFAYNIRRPVFQDPRVRQALAYAFDFEWTNKTLFYGLYTRTKSYYAGTELASSGLPDPRELALLEPLKDQVPPEVFTKTYEPPATDASGNIRDNLREAVRLFKEAGYEVKGGKLVSTATGQPLAFEILLEQGGLFDRVVGPFVKNLERLGVQATVREVDDAQYERRQQDFDYDMIVAVWGESQSPGNEQRDFWGSQSADAQGSQNYIGIKDPAVDALIGKVVGASTREDLVAACHALDRVLLWHHYVIPHWHTNVARIAQWDEFGRPAVSPRYGIDLFSWWIDPAKAEQLQAKKRAAGFATAG